MTDEELQDIKNWLPSQEQANTLFSDTPEKMYGRVIMLHIRNIERELNFLREYLKRIEGHPVVLPVDDCSALDTQRPAC